MGCAERRLQGQRSVTAPHITNSGHAFFEAYAFSPFLLDIRPLSGLLDRADCGCCVGDSPVRCVSGLVFRRKKEKQSGLSVV